MTGVVFVQTLQRGWKTMLWWAIAIGLIGALNIVAIPSAQGLKDTAEAISKMGPIMLALIGGGDIAFLATPEGYLSEQYFGIALILFAIYGIVAGLNVTANEEDKGILDMLLSLPIPRWQVILEKFLAYTILAAGVIALSSVILWLSVKATPVMTVSEAKIVEVTFNILPGTLVALAFTAFIATVVRRRTQALAIAAVFVIASFVIDFLGRAASGSFADKLGAISFYRYYDAVNVMQHGLEWNNIAILLGATVVLVGATIWFFRRRDVGV
jgi:ABC-type transport system involved in multi-copper enzyme maturation permease subunit